MNKGIGFYGLGAVAVVTLLGCGDSAGGAASGSAAATTKPAMTSSAKPMMSTKPMASSMASAAPSASAAADPAKMEMVEHDLDKVAAFKGWVAKGPADADVSEDLGGVRIVTKKVSGPGSFDLAWALKKNDLKAKKTAVQKGADTAKSKVTFTTDSAEELAWTNEVGSTKSYDFEYIFKAEGKDVTCYTVTPRETEAEIAVLKDACKSLAKKGAAPAASGSASAGPAMTPPAPKK